MLENFVVFIFSHDMSEYKQISKHDKIRIGFELSWPKRAEKVQVLQRNII